MMTNKLYKVALKGMTYSAGNQVIYGVAYVVTDHPSRAYAIVRDSIDKRGLGFVQDRELHSIELIAEDCEYPDCQTILYVDNLND